MSFSLATKAPKCAVVVERAKAEGKNCERKRKAEWERILCNNNNNNQACLLRDSECDREHKQF